MRFYIKTFGCQMNVNDSEKMRHLLEVQGLQAVESEEEADLIVVNSCAVRQKAQEKIYSYIGRFPTSRPIIVTGCVAQMERGALFHKRPHVRAVLGTHQYQQIGRMVENLANPRVARLQTGFQTEWQELIPDSRARLSQVSGYISVMEGCNNFCSYCIVPFVRGREKHRPVGHILQEAQFLADKGYREIILLGQNVNAWKDERSGLTFADLLDRLADSCNVHWIRFVTSHPAFLEPRLIDVMARQRRIARHIHLPAQSGSSRILKKMLRNYTRTQYLELVAHFRKRIPDMAFSSDFIVGFPSETDRDFRLTLSLLERVEYESVFSFLYSPRPHTPAATLRDDLKSDIKKERLQQLQELQSAIQLRNNRKRIGTTMDVLISERNPKRSSEVIGRTESHRVVNFETEKEPGRLTRVRITRAGPHSLSGEEVLLN